MSDVQAPYRRYAVVRRKIRPVRIELHPFLAAALVLAVLVLLAWSGATTSYALFRDEFLMQIVNRHSAAERVASAEINRLRTDLAHTNSRLLLERENFITRLDALTRRQADVERRQEALSTLDATPAPADDLEGDLRLGDDMSLRESSIHTERADAYGRLAAGYDALERRQRDMMAAAHERLDNKRDAIGEVYAALGIAAPVAPVKAGLGGLYLPFALGQPDAAAREISSLEDKAAEVGRLRAALDELPVRSPAPGAPFSSGYGNRLDPFLGRMAFHSGVDLEVPASTPARVTANGTVLSAGWNGGYGLAVDVEHPSGYVTRYAHLSSVSVSAGQKLAAGDVVGRTGSTGRSTGPHLHYETRLNDSPLDPRRFLNAGAKLN